MKRVVFILVLSCFSVLSLSSCVESRIRKELKEFSRATVVIPENLVKVDGMNITEYGDSGFGKAVMVVYYDSTECTECRLNHLYELNPLYELSDKYDGFEVVTIFSPVITEYDALMENLVKLRFAHPLYVDMSGDFMKNNPDIPDDALYHCFLLDSSGTPVLTGNPVYSDDMWKLFESTLAGLMEE